MKNQYPLVLITGATATGKTDLAISLAHRAIAMGKEAEVINADSLLFYKELSIGTAKPTQEEQKGIPHHLVGHQSVKNPLNASDFCDQALPLIEDLHQKGALPIIVGGSAFYVRALIKGMYEAGEISPQATEKVQSLEKEKGWSAVRALLKESDPASFKKIHENDRYRTIRALEYFLTHKKPISEQRQRIEEEGPYDFSQARNPQWTIHHIYLEVSKEEHWPIMEKRVHRMLESGLIEEVKGLLHEGLTEDLKPLQSIGYKETIDFLKGHELNNENDLIEKIYVNTRKLAKSQKTFFKKISPKETYNPLEDNERIRQDFDHFLKEQEGR